MMIQSFYLWDAGSSPAGGATILGCFWGCNRYDPSRVGVVVIHGSQTWCTQRPLSLFELVFDMLPLMDEVMREQLAFSMRVQALRTVYHWAIGETIQLRLAYTDAPQIEVVEDLPTDTVTLRLGDDVLTLRPGRSHEEDRATVREWIRERVDVTRLTRGPRRGPGAAYWRGAGRT